MREYCIDNIPDASFYANGLTALSDRISSLRKNLLVSQYYAPERKVTSPQLAALASVNGGHSVVNAQYGGVGRAFCEETGFDPQLRPDGTPRWWAVWSKGYSHPDGFIWQMYDEVAHALEAIEWVDRDHRIAIPEEIQKTATRLFEGATIQVTVNSYERNPVARNECLKHYGYACVVCGFSFSSVYGPLGQDYIHVHHLVPLSEIENSYVVDPIADLRPVCPNCHAMLHRETPALTIRQLATLLAKEQST